MNPLVVKTDDELLESLQNGGWVGLAEIQHLKPIRFENNNYCFRIWCDVVKQKYHVDVRRKMSSYCDRNPKFEYNLRSDPKIPGYKPAKAGSPAEFLSCLIDFVD